MRSCWLMVPLLGLIGSSAWADEAGEGARLKFKRGPVCMCSTGLTEADIRAASGDWQPIVREPRTESAADEKSRTQKKEE